MLILKYSPNANKIPINIYINNNNVGQNIFDFIPIEQMEQITTHSKVPAVK
jgi:hypothetical protein